jgi:signal transduction histidine kinase/integral membrane sensor domain MASE1
VPVIAAPGFPEQLEDPRPLSNVTARAGTSTGGMLPLRLGMAIFVPLILAGNEMGVVLRYPELGAAVLFPPYALLTAVLVVSAPRHWKWYIAAAAVAHAMSSLSTWPLSWVLLADVANIARALVAAVFLRRLFGAVPRLARIRVLMEFLAIAVFLAPAIGAFLGAANATWHDGALSFRNVWLAWFTSNALTGMIMLPGLLVVTRYAPRLRELRIERLRVVEASALATSLVIACGAALMVRSGAPGDLTLLLFGPSPLLIWAALRFGHGGTSLALSLVVGTAVWATDRGMGRFLLLSTDDDVLALQLFTLLTALPLLCVATIGEARRTAVQLHQALLASLKDHVAILDASGRVLEVNQSWNRFAQEPHYCPIDQVREGDDLPGVCRAVTLFPPEHPISDRGRAKASELLAGMKQVLAGETRRFETEYAQCEGGPHQWFTIRIEALERTDGGVVVTRADVSERRRAQLDIEERRREVTHLARIGMLGQLSGALAHELRQPLASILANAESAQLLMRRGSLDTLELRTILDEIVLENRHANDVIESMRVLLKRGDARVCPVDVEPLVNAVLAMVRHELVSRGVTVTVSTQVGVPPVLTDAVQAQQVLLNLILNACEAMSDAFPGGRTLLITAATATERTVRLSVRDCGSGIPPEMLPRLFEPFVTTKADGMGLGLSISRAIIASHGGRIWAENNTDGGATVHCELPMAVTSDVIPSLRMFEPALRA